MRRIHLIEIEDESWCPAPIRDGATDYLQFVIQAANPYKVVLLRLQNALRETNQTHVVDLCSGGGGPWNRLLPDLIIENPPVKVHLTDKYPNQPAFQALEKDFSENLTFSKEETDAARVPENLAGFRTMFTAFHHFRPADARAILADAVEKKSGHCRF